MPNCLRHGADYETLIPLSSFDFTVSLAGQMTDGLWPCGFMIAKWQYAKQAICRPVFEFSLSPGLLLGVI